MAVNTAHDPEAIADLDRIQRFTRLLDSQFRIPGTNITFGLDPILGLIPGAGDILSFGISGFVVAAMARHGVKGQVVIMMIGNILIDFVVGSVPIVGSIADFGLKANSRNMRLLRKHYQEGKYQKSLAFVLLMLMVVMLSVIGLSIWGMIALLRWLF
ncbi:MAG: DUF4112 domain-containing protein [Bacteroidia bacterium]|nr:DUF4112 domain-containing protein [Bacteroidia bacterium]